MKTWNPFEIFNRNVKGKLSEKEKEQSLNKGDYGYSVKIRPLIKPTKVRIRGMNENRK